MTLTLEWACGFEQFGAIIPLPKWRNGGSLQGQSFTMHGVQNLPRSTPDG